MKRKGVEMEGEGNPEWADVLKNILSMDKPKSKNSMILSRAEKLDPKLEKDSDDEDQESKPTPSELVAKANLKKEWIARGRYKPNPSEEGERERKLRRIAVAGVVQLFNAVGKQQRGGTNPSGTSNSSVLPPARQFKSLDKKSFFNLLLGKNEVKEEDVSKDEKPEDIKEEEEVSDNNSKNERKPASGQWDVLRNDFMMSTKLKDWDKQIED